MVWSISVSESGLVLLYKRWSGWPCRGGGEGGRWSHISSQSVTHAYICTCIRTYVHVFLGSCTSCVASIAV